MTSAPITPVGFSPTIECFGDSLTAGTGGTDLASLISRRLPGRLCNNWGIGGQKASQIAGRQGGKPILITATGNAFNSWTGVTLTAISEQFLSTPAENNTRHMSGSVNGVQCFIERTATGGPPSTSEVYKIYPAYDTSGSIPANSEFIPDAGYNARDSIQVLWLGRNDVTATLSGVDEYVAACVAQINLPRRYVVIGVLPSLEETTGSGSTRTQIDAANAILSDTYADLFVPSTPPTVAEMTTIGYTPSGQDNTDIAAGVFPTGMRSDGSSPHVHLTTDGYRIIANRVVDLIVANNW